MVCLRMKGIVTFGCVPQPAEIQLLIGFSQELDYSLRLPSSQPAVVQSTLCFNLASEDEDFLLKWVWLGRLQCTPM